MLNQAEWAQCLRWDVFYPYGHEFLGSVAKCWSIYGPWAWNGFRKLCSTHICATGSHNLVPLHQSVEKLCLKKRNRESFQFPSRLHLDFLSGDLTAVDSGQSRRPARRPEVQMCRVYGLHLRHIQVCVRVCSYINHRNLTVTFAESAFVCDPSSRTVNFDIVKYLYDFLWACCEWREVWDLKEGFIRLKARTVRSRDWTIIPIMSLPPCGWWMSLFFLWSLLLNICILSVSTCFI